jgi:hypothetical protein
MKWNYLCLSLLLAATTAISSKAQSVSDPVIFITDPLQIPSNAVSVGKLKTPMGKGTLEELKEQAIKKKANVVLINYFYVFYVKGKSYTNAKAEGFRIENIDSLHKLTASLPDTAASKEYAYIYLYRPAVMEGIGGKKQVFDVVVNDTLRATITHGFTYAFKTAPGKYVFAIEKKGQQLLEINAEAGKKYFIHCEATKATQGFVPGQVSITFGGWSGRIFQITDPAAGEIEYRVARQAQNNKDRKDDE